MLMTLMAAATGIPSMASAQLPTPTPPLEIGTLDGPDTYAFGDLRKIVFDGSDRLLVLDGYFEGIRWYHADGTYGGQLGRSGQGPGEFVEATGFDIDDSGRVYVIDPGNANRLTVFEWADSVYTYSSDQLLPQYSSDVCVAGDRRYVLMPRSALLIQELDSDGQVLHRFGQPVAASASEAKAFGPQPHWPLSHGRLTCSESTEMVMYASEISGDIHAFGLDGQLLWETSLPGFFRVQLKRSEQLGVCCAYHPDPDSQTIHRIMGVAIRGTDRVLVSLWEYGQGGAVDGYETRVLRLADGAQIDIQEYGMVVTDANGLRLVGHTKEPYSESHRSLSLPETSFTRVAHVIAF